MNREIKFRAWDAVDEKMYLFDLIDLRQDQEKSDMSNLFLSYDSTHIMQYTGIKDENGKEIYEGDIMKTPAGIGLIKWDKCFIVYWGKEDYTTLHDTPYKYIEVIGNIYENPELLQTN